VIEWILATIPYFKTLHILGLIVWCGGLLALPLMLGQHDPGHSPREFRRLRRSTHLTYTMLVTPAAVIAVIAGTWLIFMREVFFPWLYAKLFFVFLLVCVHAWLGHIIVTIAESGGQRRPPSPVLPISALLVSMAAILVLVLAKPDLGGIDFPDWLTEPRGRQLLLFEVPRP
jgi:protoporphyrinogen IX oxidase